MAEQLQFAETDTGHPTPDTVTIKDLLGLTRAGTGVVGS